MAEALERLLSHCDNDAHKVADRLDTQHRRNEIPLLGGGVVMSPASNPSMLGIKAHIPPDGRAFLYVDVRKAFTGDFQKDGVVWDGKTVKSLEDHHKFWAFDRTTFEAHFPHEPSLDKPVLIIEHEPIDKPVLTLEPSSDQVTSDEPKNRGGNPGDYNLVDLLAEAFVYVGAKGLPKTVTGQGGLHEQLKMQLGSRCPEPSRFSEIFGPLVRRIKAEQRGKSAAKSGTRPQPKTS